MGRRATLKGGGGSTTWPGTSSQLVAGNGSVVAVGSGLSLSGAMLAGPAHAWFASAQASLVAKLGLAAGTFALATDDHFTLAGNLGWSGLSLTTTATGGIVTVPQSPSTNAATAIVMSKTSTSYGFGFRAQVNPTTSGDETYLGVSSSTLSQYVIAVLGNLSGTKYIRAQLNDGTGSLATGNSTVAPDANYHTILVAFKYAAGASVLSISVDGEAWINSASTSKNPPGQAGYLLRNSTGTSVASLDKSLYISSF